MSGIIRNLITLLQAFFFVGKSDPQSRTTVHFLVTPFDSGASVLKSDKYLQFAESAQLDFVVKTKLIGTLLRNRIGFVNASQLVRFVKPIAVFRRVRVETGIVHADEKCVYFSHSLFLKNTLHGEILVKMKFKKGAITVRPSELVGEWVAEKPLHIQSWDQTLEAM